MDNSRKLIQGAIYSSDDRGAINDAMVRGFKVIALVDVGEGMYFPGCTIFSNLLPPPESLNAFINGDELNGKRIYYDYLMSPGREESIVTLLEVIFKKNVNILIYAEFDPNREFHILEVLLEFFKIRFGILIGVYANPNIPFMVNMNPMQLASFADILFVNERIDQTRYALMMPPTILPSERACNLLLKNINYGFGSMQECYIACCRLLEDIKRCAVDGRKPAVLCVKEKLEKQQEDEINKKVMESKTRFG